MKVVLINGSPKKEGNTFCALDIVATELKNEGIDTEIIHIGNKVIRGCLGCNHCFKSRDEKCIIDDELNKNIQAIKEADGLVLGSPVHFAAMGGTMKSFMDRLGYVASANGNFLRHKVGASVVAVRRSGGIPTFNQLNNYLNYMEMTLPSSNYWNVIHGHAPKEALKDEEGVQIMRVLGQNIAWTLKGQEESKGKIKEPEMERKIYTNFVR